MSGALLDYAGHRKPMPPSLVGQRFGRLVVLAAAGQSGRTSWLCRCDCGNTTVVRGSNLLSGNTASCGCLHAAGAPGLARTHGRTNTPAYWRWKAMLQRCTNPRNRSWPNYGGRGITVCKRWRSFEAFHADMGDPPAGMTLDRIDADGPYAPENCRWATPVQQARNTTKTPYLTHDGLTLPLIEWAERVGVNFRTLHLRIKRYGWSVEKALTTPVSERAR